MRRHHKTEREKQLMHLSRRYNKLSTLRRSSGTWEPVEPYQRGWMRSYVLRDDAANRRDAQELRRLLDRLNVVKYCNREDFQQRNWKTHQWEPIPQPLGHFTTWQYAELTVKQQSFFTLQTWVDVTRHRGFAEKALRSGYVFHNAHLFFQFRVAPNIITQHWIPDAEIERQFGEVRRTIDVNNLWPKISKAIGESYHQGYRWREKDIKYQNSEGFEYVADELY